MQTLQETARYGSTMIGKIFQNMPPGFFIKALKDCVAMVGGLGAAVLVTLMIGL